MKRRLFVSTLLTLFVFADCKGSSLFTPKSSDELELDAHARFINDAIVREFSQMQLRKKPVNYKTPDQVSHSDSDTDIDGGTSMVVGEDGALSIKVKVRPNKFRVKSKGHNSQTGDSQSEASIVQNMKVLRPPIASVPNAFYNNHKNHIQQVQQNTQIRQQAQKQKELQQQFQLQQLQQVEQQKIQKEQIQEQKLQQQYRPQQGTLTERQLLIQKQQMEINNYLINIISGLDKQKTNDNHSVQKFPGRQEPLKFPINQNSKFPVQKELPKLVVNNQAKVPVWFEPPKFPAGRQSKSPIRHGPNKVMGDDMTKTVMKANQTDGYDEIIHTVTHFGPVEHIYTHSEAGEIVSDSVKNISRNLNTLFKNARRAHRRIFFKIRNTIEKVPVELQKKVPRINIIKPKDSIIFN